MQPTAFNPETAALESHGEGEASAPSRVLMYGVWALIAAGLFVYAQTWAFTDDEGFHLLTAQLIKTGMRPYLDFCFPQTPFNAYWNAFWMRVFGESWRTAHAVAAIETAGAVVLAAQFVYTRLPERAWRVAGAIAAAVAAGCNANLVEFGPLGQAYGICLFSAVCAFRLAVAGVERRGWWAAACAGVFAGVAAASSLLAAMVAPVLLIWFGWCNRAGNRGAKVLAFAIGTALPFLPLLWLFTRSPRVVWFNVAQYHLQYRVVYWPAPLRHDLETLTAWAGEPQSLLLGLLAIFGAVYIARRSAWNQERRDEFYLCGWLALAIAAELAFAHPTFARYFCLLAPFLGILVVPGLYALGSRVLGPERPFWPVLIICILSGGALARTIYNDRNFSTWPEYEKLARKLESVTPAGKPMFTEEQIYFLTKRRPPQGMEFGYSHKLKLPPQQMSALHIAAELQLQREVAAGAFGSAATCDNDFSNTYALDKAFRQKADLHNCSVYWEWQPPAEEAK